MSVLLNCHMILLFIIWLLQFGFSMFVSCDETFQLMEQLTNLAMRQYV